MTNLKELAHKYYKEMSSDSKRKSAEAERKLCKILNHVITKMETIETIVDYGVRNYPYRIYRIEYDGYYGKTYVLPYFRLELGKNALYLRAFSREDKEVIN